MASYCKKRGIRGIVCDGAIRDRGGLAAMEDFPVYARATTPNGHIRTGREKSMCQYVLAER